MKLIFILKEILRDPLFNPLVANSFAVTGISQNDESKKFFPDNLKISKFLQKMPFFWVLTPVGPGVHLR